MATTTVGLLSLAGCGGGSGGEAHQSSDAAQSAEDSGAPSSPPHEDAAASHEDAAVAHEDAGSKHVDAGTQADAGAHDAGAQKDSGSPPHMKPHDAGSSAADAGADAAAATPCSDAPSCGQHARCDDSSGTAQCVCESGYQDRDDDGSCKPACDSHSCPAHSTCDDSSGTVSCTCGAGYTGTDCSQDLDACAAADTADANPCNAVDTGATCSDDAAPAITYTCHCSSGFAPNATGCVDIDECATNNGGCGDAGQYTCANHVGAAPTCTAIDECATNNGGCGDPAFIHCTDQGGTPPTCMDIDECATDNGGCGDKVTASCTNNPGAPPTCSCAAQYGGPGCAYHLVYRLNLPAAAPDWDTPDQVPYDVDNSAVVAPFERVAYRLQLDDNWIWVEIDPFTDKASSLGVPVDDIWDQSVNHITVDTNGSAVSKVTDADGGSMEFFSNCYGTGADSMYDAHDELQSPDCFGSIQMFRDGATLFAINHWSDNNGGNIDVGIGPGPNPDWTFANNGASFTTRRFEVYVREIRTCSANSCLGHGSCDDSSGLPVCTCGTGYAGARCAQCASGYQDNDADGACTPACAANTCTTAGETCFDDSGHTECLTVQGKDCQSILAADSSASDGRYVTDFDGDGGNDPRLSYCDMSHGGFTLLAVADGSSTAFGNNSPVWAQNARIGSTVIGLSGGDYKGFAYGELPTQVVRLCYQDLNTCHDFAHGMGISLQAFFANAVSYDEYASNIIGHADTGLASARTQYLTDIGAAEDGSMCGYWLGINERAMASGIGLMGDANSGCGSGSNPAWIDDVAIGVGLQSCADANGCAPLGDHQTAGRQRGWTGKSGDLGPWFMLGR
jgi:hypothetical protein